MKACRNPGMGIRPLVLSLLLSLSLSLPAAANEMWDALFKEHLENAKAGEADAQYELGIMYLKGQGVEQDRDKAVKWLQAAAKSGYSLADVKLTRIEEQEAKFKQLRNSADRGDLEAQYEVAMMYLKGRGVQTDETKGLAYLKKAADKGDAKAITRLGIISYKGEVGKPDYKKAVSLLNSVSGNSVLAQYYLGEMYAAGAGVKKDYATAIDWYKKAAAGGFNRASGKIINLEEEQKTEQRRKLNAAREAQRLQALKAEQTQRASEARESARQSARAAKAAAESKKAERKKVAARQAEPEPETGFERLLASHWLRGKRPVDYLPSQVTRCDRDDDRLVCFSEVLHRQSGTKNVEYRVKSIISDEDGAFAIVYRNLVLDVTDAAEPDDQPLGYDNQLEQGFHIKTGWTSEHKVICKPDGKHNLDCDKDQTYNITLVAEH